MRLTLFASLFAIALPLMAEAGTVTVFAAASLKGPLDQAAAAWKAATGNEVVVSYGASSALAKQIEAGAPADVFLSAATNWMDALDKDKLIKADTRSDLWSNRLVLVAHDPKAAPVRLDAATDLATLIGDGKLAMALVDAVPAGQYGKEALRSLGLWDKVSGLVVQTDDVKAALKLVVSGNAGYGVVYATDAKGAAVTVVATFPEDSHKPIVYPGAVIAASTVPEAADFLMFLHTKPASDLFSAQGFVILP